METSASNKFGVYVLIAAAGSGSRLSADRPKQYMKIGGKAILRHAIESFMACDKVKDVRVVIDFKHKNYYEEAVQGLSLAPPIEGGKTRKDSVFNGIKSFSNLKSQDNVLIHDAARPFVCKEDILGVIAALKDSRAATLAVPVADSLRQEEDGELVDRTGLWAMQTPQGFHYGVIREAHERADPAVAYSDDTSLMSVPGVDVVIVPGHRQNFKITTADDLEMAEQLIRREVRTGTGYDVHAFVDGSGVRLCGVDVPHDKTLSGHSDADAGLHALTDAILGAIAAGDIGQHFPPSDPQWKGTDSAVFLRKAVALVQDQGGVITGLDVTLICEAPKIGPHRAAMQARVAAICGLSPARVSIKATTTEGLGFTGRGEGLAAQAIATVEVLRAE